MPGEQPPLIADESVQTPSAHDPAPEWAGFAPPLTSEQHLPPPGVEATPGHETDQRSAAASADACAPAAGLPPVRKHARILAICLAAVVTVAVLVIAATTASQDSAVADHPTSSATVGAITPDETQTAVPTESLPAANVEDEGLGRPNAPAVEPQCVLNATESNGDTGPQVSCIERALAERGLFAAPPDNVFDATTKLAVQQFQAGAGLADDGIVGPVTAQALGVWAGPGGPLPVLNSCPPSGHAAVVDRFNQRAWLCDNGAVSRVLPITSSAAQPDPGDYRVKEFDKNASSTLTGRRSTMTHFVVFASGRYTGARVGFHAVPKYSDGSWVQPLDSVGTPSLYGASSGCIRVLPDDSVAIWDWLKEGDPVIVVS